MRKILLYLPAICLMAAACARDPDMQIISLKALQKEFPLLEESSEGIWTNNSFFPGGKPKARLLFIEKNRTTIFMTFETNGTTNQKSVYTPQGREERYYNGKDRLLFSICRKKRGSYTNTYMYPDGRPHLILPFSSGKLNGQVLEFHQEGGKKRTASFKNGRLHGTCVEYDSAGIVIDETGFKKGIPVSCQSGTTVPTRPKRWQGFSFLITGNFSYLKKKIEAALKKELKNPFSLWLSDSPPFKSGLKVSVSLIIDDTAVEAEQIRRILKLFRENLSVFELESDLISISDRNGNFLNDFDDGRPAYASGGYRLEDSDERLAAAVAEIRLKDNIEHLLEAQINRKLIPVLKRTRYDFFLEAEPVPGVVIPKDPDEKVLISDKVIQKVRVCFWLDGRWRRASLFSSRRIYSPVSEAEINGIRAALWSAMAPVDKDRCVIFMTNIQFERSGQFLREDIRLRQIFFVFAGFLLIIISVLFVLVLKSRKGK